MSSTLQAIGESGFRVALSLLPAWLAEPFAAEMQQTFVAGPASRNTNAAPAGKPEATRAAAIGTDAVAQT